MALSFGESKRLATQTESNESIMTASLDDIATFDLDETSQDLRAVVDSDFTKSDKYTWIDEYTDTEYSLIDANRNISVPSSTEEVTQENNGQIVMFEMPRHYDGIDLMDMTIQIHYMNADSEENYASPVNLSYSNSSIRFGWLLSDTATAKDGTLTFELMASGAVTVPNSDTTKSYLWRSRPNGKLTVIKSLSGKHMTDPTGDDWYTSFLATMNQKVGLAQTAAASAQQAVLDAQSAVSSVDEKLAQYYNKTEVDGFVSLLKEEISEVDGLTNFSVRYDAETQTLQFLNGTTILNTIVLSTDPSDTWVQAYDEKIDTKISTAVSEAVTPVQTDLDTYKESNDLAVSKKAEQADLVTATNDIATNKSAISAVEDSIALANTDIAKLQEQLKDFNPDENSGREYDITYEDSKLSLLENGSVKTQVIIEGGGGGGGNTSVVTITRLGDSALTIIFGENVSIPFNFKSVDNTGDDTGSGTGVWYVGNTKVATQTITQGDNIFDVTQYLHTGDNTVKLQVTDSMGSISTKNWTVNIVEFYLESTFDDSLTYNGEVVFRYTPYGNISKIVHFVLDGVELGTTVTAITGRQLTYTLPPQAHGSHLLEVYMTANINSQQVSSDKLHKDIMWATTGETAPIISCATINYTTKQYTTIGIKYTVYNPISSTTTVTLAVDGMTSSTLSVGRTVQTWSFKSSSIGTHTLTIACGETVKTISVIVEDLGIEIEQITTNLAFDFNPTGKTNADSTRLWTDGNTKMSVSDNFDWSNGGYQIDEDGDTYFCVKAGTTATIGYKLFADDAKKLGKNFKTIFKTTNVRDYDATAITCLNNNLGLNIQAQKITLTSAQNQISLPTCEDDFMEFEFNILPDSQHNEMVLWLDGIPCKVELYDSSDNFTQSSPVGITIGSADCDVWIYRMKSYMMNLTDDEILDNFIADAKNAEEMIERYNRNNIVNAAGELEPDLLAEKCPDLRIIKISAPTFTTGKKNEVADTTIQQIYKNGRAVEDNWTATGSHKGQGTSSDHYGEAGRNIDINCSGGFIFGDDSTGSKYALAENSVAEKYFNIKVNIASSENANNALLADEYNTFNPYARQAKKDNPKVRDTMAFYPCVVFVQETDTDNATVFNDGQWHFYACGDIGNSKKNSDTMGMDSENHKEFIVEIDNNTDAQTRFLSTDFSEETWDGDHSFEFRYSNKNCTEEELQAGKDAWIRVQNWVVNATDEEFKNNFEDYFIKDSALYFYLFTERHTMVDNRAKNVFPHTEDLIHWDFCFDYDNDTAQGNDNEGGLTLTYGYEDVDTIGTKSVFNASDSKLWCKVRDLFADDLATMFRNRESALAWSASRILKKFEAYQDVKPERLWIMDMRRKYFRTYEDNGTTSYLPMMHGNKRHQRRQFQKYQEKYIASKYNGSAATSDDMTIRGYTPTNWTGVEPDGTFHIRPYADTYVSVLYGSNPVKVRGKRGQTYEIKCPVEAMNDTEVYVYNASLIQSIGDISGFYPGYVDFSHGTKLTDLLIGSSVEGYSNTNMTDFAVGNNTLLEHLNLQNVPNLKKSIDLTGCVNLEEFLADGSGITGVAFATAGKIETAHLPAIASLTVKNLNHLTDLTISDYNNITTLVIENCSTIDIQGMIEKCTNLHRVRITGVDWSLEDTTLLETLYPMAGIDENSYNTSTSVLEGKITVPIIREQQLIKYNAQWPDLTISYNTLIEQYMWTFVNKDGSVLDIQYVDKGEKAVDPTTRADNPISIPTYPSTISTVFTFKGWDITFTAAFSNQTVTALYSESVRQYTVRYLNRTTVMQETTAPYGTMVLYEGETPTYVTEESAYKYYLFSGWDKGGYVTGDKDINAVYDICQYSDGYFSGKEIGDLRPVEIYAMTKVAAAVDATNKTFLDTYVHDKDSVKITMGHDFSYDDIEDITIFSSAETFTGSNYYDTGIKLLSEDRDWVLAVDYKMTTAANTQAVMMQCFETNGMNGFRLWNNSGSKMVWGSSSTSISTLGTRDMVVLRHTKGDNNLYIYSANTYGSTIQSTSISRTRVTKTDATLVFGCAKADDGAYESYANGTVYWAKLWYADLGDSACQQLAAWTHEDVTYEMCGTKKYYLSDGSNKRCAMTFLQTTTLGPKMTLNSSSGTNTGGWEATTIRTYLDNRLPAALPIGWQQLIKTVKVSSSAGNKSSEIVTADSKFFIPSAVELSSSMTGEPYVYEGSTISYMTTNASRACTDPDGNATSYSTRSPNVQYASYFYSVGEGGELYGYTSPTENNGVRLMFCV